MAATTSARFLDTEASLLAALSAARTNPSSLATIIRERSALFKGKDYFPPERGGKVAVPTKVFPNNLSPPSLVFFSTARTIACQYGARADKAPF